MSFAAAMIGATRVKTPKTKNADFAYTVYVYLKKMAHGGLSHLDLHCLLSFSFYQRYTELLKNRLGSERKKDHRTDLQP